MGNNRRDTKPAPTSKKPLAPQLKPTKHVILNKSKKRQPTNVISRPWTVPLYEEVTKEERDIVLDRIRKEIVDSSAIYPVIKSYYVRGVNQVARLIAKRELRVVVFANNPDSSVGAFAHIPVLCRLHKVPICVLHLSSKAFGNIFQQKSVAVFGIKRLPKQSTADRTTAEDRSNTSQDATSPVDAPKSLDPTNTANALTEVEYERLASISDFLVSKASKKNNSLQQ